MQPDTLTPAQAREQLDVARREAADAATLIDTLAERVRSGDTDVTAEQMAGQKQLAELAELRVTAAERKLTEAQRADLDARARAAGDRIRALVDADSTAPVLDAAQEVGDAVRRLVEVSAERDAAIRDVAAEGVELNDELGRTKAHAKAYEAWVQRGRPNGEEPPARMSNWRDVASDLWPSREYDFMTSTGVEPTAVAVGQGRVRAVPSARVLGVVLRAVLSDNTARHQVAEILGMPHESVMQYAEAVPGLAELLPPQAVLRG